MEPTLPPAEQVQPVEGATVAARQTLMPRPSMKGRALLAVSLFVGFYLLSLAVAAILLFIPIAELIFLHRIHFQIAIFCIVGAGAILWSIIPRRDRFMAPGPRLEPSKQPQLFKTITEVAESTGQEMPAEVYLVPDVNAFVTQRGGFMGFGSRRVMGIGLALLQVVSVSELRAVIAHEFGHYYGGDTKLGPWIYKTREAIGRTIVGLARHSSWLYKPFQWYGMFFLRVTQAISRRQEFVADELAARTVGSRAMINGLRAIHGGALAFDAYWGSEVAPVLNSGYRPPLVEGFSRFVAAGVIADALSRSVDQEIAEGKSDIYDTHPSLPERIAAVEQLPAGEEVTDDRRAISLLADADQLETELLVSISDEAQVRALKPITWEATGKQAWLPEYRELVREHSHVLGTLTPLDIPRLSGDLEGFGMKLVPKGVDITEEDVPHIVRFAVRVLGASIIVALHEAGWELHAPVGEPIYCERDGVRFEPFAAIQALSMSTMKTEEWKQQCIEAGIADMNLGMIAPAARAESHPA